MPDSGSSQVTIVITKYLLLQCCIRYYRKHFLVQCVIQHRDAMVLDSALDKELLGDSNGDLARHTVLAFADELVWPACSMAAAAIAH